MKNLWFLMILLPLLSISCTPEDALVAADVSEVETGAEEEEVVASGHALSYR